MTNVRGRASSRPPRRRGLGVAGRGSVVREKSRFLPYLSSMRVYYALTEGGANRCRRYPAAARRPRGGGRGGRGGRLDDLLTRELGLDALGEGPAVLVVVLLGVEGLGEEVD